MIVAHVARAELARGALHAADAVVVARERERPRVRALVVRAEQSRGGDGGEPGIVALVDHVIDAHVDAAGRARELPEARRADVRARRRIERRLDVRQRRQLDGQPALGEDAAHVALPAALPDQAGAELVRLAELEAHLAGGAAQRRVRDATREQREHALLLGVEVGAPAAREALQQRLVVLAPLAQEALLAEPRTGSGQAHGLVDEREILAVVQQPAARVHLAVDALPELDARHQRGRLRKVGLARGQRAHGRRGGGQEVRRACAGGRCARRRGRRLDPHRTGRAGERREHLARRVGEARAGDECGPAERHSERAEAQAPRCNCRPYTHPLTHREIRVQAEAGRGSAQCRGQGSPCQPARRSRDYLRRLLRRDAFACLRFFLASLFERASS